MFRMLVSFGGVVNIVVSEVEYVAGGVIELRWFIDLPPFINDSFRKKRNWISREV